MNLITKQVEIEKSLNCEEIESSLKKYGNPLRWAIVKVLQDKFVVEGVFFQE